MEYAAILRSQPFQFFIGKDAQCFTVPSALFGDISKPLNNLINNENFEESLEGQCILDDCEGEVFAAFCQFCFSGKYDVPTILVETMELEDSADEKPTDGSVSTSLDVSEPDPAYERSPEPMPEPVPDSVLKSVSEWSTSARGKKKRDKACRRRTLGLCYSAPEEDDMVESPPEGEETASKIDYAKHRDNYDELWITFKELDLRKLCSTPTNDSAPQPNRHSSIEAAPLVFHSKVFVIATKYLAPRLQRLALENLHDALYGLPKNEGSIHDIFDLLQYCFQTGEERVTSHDSALRKVVVAFAAARVPELKELGEFHELLRETPELGSALVMALG